MQTLGYYSANDGGAGLYRIINDNSLENDGGFVHALDNELQAKLILKNNIVNFKQLGAKDEIQANFDKHDNKEYLEKYLNYLEANEGLYLELYIPHGIWCFSETCITTRNINIRGDLQFYHNWIYSNNTIITSLNEVQRYVWKLGDNADFDYSSTMSTLRHLNLDNLTFSSGVYTSNNIPTSLNKITRGALYLDNIDFSIMPHLHFNYVDGIPLTITTCWEIYFDTLNFRHIFGHDTAVIKADAAHAASGVNSPNISAVDIKSVMFEACNGHYIQLDPNCAWDNNHIHYINIEGSFANEFDETGTVEAPISSESYDVHECIIAGGKCGQFVIDTIVMQLVGGYVHKINDTSYIRDIVIGHLFGDSNDNSAFSNFTIGNLNYELNKVPIKIIHQDEEIKAHFQNDIVINNIQSNSQSNVAEPIFDVKQYNRITVKNINFTNQGVWTQQVNGLQSLYYIQFYEICAQGWDVKCLCYDKDSVNRLHVCSKRFGNNSNSSVAYLKNFKACKMKMRIFIPSDERLQVSAILLKSGENITKYFTEIEGNGRFTWYEFDFTNVEFDEDSSLTLNSSNVNALFDVLYVVL